MKQAKGLPAAVDEPGILLFKSYCLRNEREATISKKIGFLAKHCTFNFDLHHDLKTSCFDSNPTESSAIDRAPFRI